MRRVDKLGRIVIPQELREKHGLNEGVTIEFFDKGDEIAVKASEPFCKLCKGKIHEKAVFALCEDCVDKIMREYNKKGRGTNF